jgi:hypothetical protein
MKTLVCGTSLLLLAGLALHGGDCHADEQPVADEQPIADEQPGGHNSVILVRLGEVREPISIHAAPSIVQRLGATGRAARLRDDYFNQLGRDMIGSLQKRGLSLVGVRRVSFLSEAPPDSVPLTMRNERLWDLLAPKTCDGEPTGDEVTVCVSSDGCQCTWCETVTIEPVCDPDDPHPVCTD